MRTLTLGLTLHSIATAVRAASGYVIDFATLTASQLQSRFGWVRTGAGTMIDSGGTVRYGAHNLLPINSSDFSAFTQDGVSVSVNAAQAPDGSTTADTITGVSGNRRIFTVRNVFTIGSVSAISIHVKKRIGSVIRFDLVNQADSNASFDFDTGLATVLSPFSSISVTALPDGWYRLGFTFTASNAGSCLGPKLLNTGDSYDAWGYQLNLGALTDYVPTTTAPIFLTRAQDYTFGVPGLLLEGARTNRLAYTEDFSHATWVKSNVTVTANAAVAPDGATTADTLTATAANGTVLQTITPGAGSQNHSLYLKRLTGTGNVQLTADGSTWATVTINSSTWTRCDVTQTAPSGAIGVGIRLVTSGDAVYAWGAQHE